MASTRETIWKWGTEYSGAGTAEFKLDLDDLKAKTEQGSKAFDDQSKKLIELELSKRRVLRASQSLGMGLAVTATQGLSAKSAFEGGAVAVGTFSHLLGGFGTLLGPAILLLGGLAEGVFKFGEKEGEVEEKTAKLTNQIEAFSSASEVLRESLNAQSIAQAKVLEFAKQQLEVDRERAKFGEEAKNLRKEIEESLKREADLDQQVQIQANQLIVLVKEQARTHTALGGAIAQQSAKTADLTQHLDLQRDKTASLRAELDALTGASKAAAAASFTRGTAETIVLTQFDLEAKALKTEIDLEERRTKQVIADVKKLLDAGDDRIKKDRELTDFVAKMAVERESISRDEFAKRRAELQRERDVAITFIANHVNSKSQAERAMTTLEKLEGEKRIQIARDEARAKIQLASVTATQIGAVIGALAQYEEATGKKTFGDLKALKEAEVVVNTAAAIMSALGTSGNIYTGVALAASAAITGALQIATIEAAQPGTSSITSPTLSTGTVGTQPGVAPSPGGVAPGPSATSTSAPGVTNVQIILENLNVNVLDPSAISDATYRAIARRLMGEFSFDIHQRGGTF